MGVPPPMDLRLQGTLILGGPDITLGLRRATSHKKCITQGLQRHRFYTKMEPRWVLTPSDSTCRARDSKTGALEASPTTSGSVLEAPRWFLTPSERTWRAREAKMGALEASPREFGSALEALWTRLERRWGVQGRPREPEMDAK